MDLRRLITQMVRFGLVGTASFVVDAGIYFILTRGSAFFGAHIIFANAISFTTAAVFNFFLNRRWTFGAFHALRRAQFIKFYPIAVSGLLLNSAALWLLVRAAGVHDLIAKLLAAVVVFFWNFTLQRRWTFKPL